MNTLIVAVVTVSGSIAEFVEMNTLFCPDALDVIEWTSDHHLLRTWSRETRHCSKSKNPFSSTLIIHALYQFTTKPCFFNFQHVKQQTTLWKRYFMVRTVSIFAGKHIFEWLHKVLILYDLFYWRNLCICKCIYICITALFFTHNRCSLCCFAVTGVDPYNKLPNSPCQQRAAV